MPEIERIRYTLSIEELAQCFTLVNLPAIGAKILENTFADVPPEAMHERMIAAGHSLLARGLINLNQAAVFEMDEKLQWALLPFARFTGVLQVRINGEKNNTFNIYLNPRGSFTADLTDGGLVHTLEYGGRSLLPALFPELIPMPQDGAEEPIDAAQISMKNLGELFGAETAKGLSLLRKAGLKEELAQALSQDAAAPVCMGSVVFLDVSSDDPEQERLKPSQVKRGLLFLATLDRGWLFRFTSLEDEALGDILPGTSRSLMEEVKRMLP